MNMSNIVASDIRMKENGGRRGVKALFSDANFLKGFFTAILAFFALIVYLFVPHFSFGDQSMSVDENIRFFDIFGSLFAGGKIEIATEIGNLSVSMPSLAAVIVIIGVLMPILQITAGVLTVFFPEKTVRILPALNLFVTVWQIAVFLFFILDSGMSAADIWGETKPFYKVFWPESNYMIVGLISLASFGISIVVNEKTAGLIYKNRLMYLFLLVPAVLIAVYNVYPMILAFVLSMKNYVISDGIWGSDWIGFGNFSVIFTDGDTLRILLNTIKISFFRMVCSIVPPIILAIMLFDMGHEKVRKGIQTIIYIPHFFSWVVVYAIAYSFINPDGLINNLFDTPVRILSNEKLFVPLLLITELWKECGWNTILYMAALSNVDPNLNEAAAIDGAGPLRRLWFITLPCIKPTIVFTSVMAVGNLLKGAGYEQIMLFGSEVMENAQVIDTWVIWKGLKGLQYGIGAAVSFFQSLIGMFMVVACNKLSKKWVGVGLY